MKLEPAEAETLQILRMDEETEDLLLDMFPDDMQIDARRLAATLGRLEALDLVERKARPDADWWALTPTGQELATSVGSASQR